MTTRHIEDLPKDKDRLAVLLSNFDCVILADVPADSADADKPENALSEEQQEVIRSNTHEQGCGLVVIGGPDSYGAGGWQNTAVEKALPVESRDQVAQGPGQGRPGPHHARLAKWPTATSGKRRSPSWPSRSCPTSMKWDARLRRR